MALTIFKGNRLPSLTDTIKVNGVAFDLTSSTVKLRMRLANSNTLKVDTTAAVVSAPAGTVRYDWAAIDVDTSGEYVAWWQVTTSGKTQETSEFEIEVLDHAPQTASLCTLADVRDELETPDNQRTRDEKILGLIPPVSAQIIREYEREWAPVTSSAVRVYPWNPSQPIVDLTPNDLRSTTLVRLSPEETAPLSLTLNTDYVLAPVGDPDGVYTSLRMSSYLVARSQTLYRFGYINVEVTGAWGWATIPPEVNRAAALTVAAQLRRDISALGLSQITGEPPDSIPDMPTNYSIPPAARRLLAPFRRTAGVF
jgi:hypothetical protein